jgi:hypothetical protein
MFPFITFLSKDSAIQYHETIKMLQGGRRCLQKQHSFRSHCSAGGIFGRGSTVIAVVGTSEMRNEARTFSFTTPNSKRSSKNLRHLVG